MMDDNSGAEMYQFLQAFHAMWQLQPRVALVGLLYWAMRIQAAADHAQGVEAELECEEQGKPGYRGGRG